MFLQSKTYIHSVGFIAFIAALGGLLFGYDTGVISGAILFIHKDFHLSDTQVEVLVSAVLAGAVLGACFSGFLSDRYGRRHLLIWTALLFVIASIFTAISTNYSMLMIGRIAVGIAIGISSMISPLYIAEIAPAKHRGGLVALNQFAITIGILISYLIDFLLAKQGQWRWMMGLAAVPAGILCTSMIFLPDSPRWLILKGRIDQAKAVLSNLRDKIEAEREEKEILEHVKDSTLSFKESMTPWVKRALVIGMGLAIFQQLTGINTVIYYAPEIFEMAGIKTASSAILATFYVGIVNTLSTVAALWLLDRAGRRALLLIGLTGMIIGLATLAYSFLDHTHDMGWITLVSLSIYVASFAIGIGPVFWVLIAEIYPLSIRGKAMSIATISNWGANLIVALTFLTLLQKLGTSNTFFLYSFIGVLAWIFSLLLVPETKGYSLEEIQKKF